MAKVRITKVKSGIKAPQRHKDTLTALGFQKLNQTIEHEATPQILGMLEKIKHLIVVEHI
jgi:large subunit ribosomal protein L30